MITFLATCLSDILPPVLCDGGASLFTLLAAALSAGSGSANMSFSGKMNKKTIAFQREEAEKNRQFNSAEAEKARQFTLDMYNQFQSPSALVNQYKDAGLNPALLAGELGTPGSFPSPSASSSVMPSAVYDSDALMGGLSNFASFAHAAKEMALLNQEKRQKQAETELALANTAKAQADTIGQQILNGYTPKLKEAELRNMQVQADAALSTIRLNDSATELNASQRALIVAKTLTEAENQKHIAALAKNENDRNSLIAFEKNLLIEQIQSARVGRSLTKAQIEKIAHENNLSDAQALHLCKMNEQVDATIKGLGIENEQKMFNLQKDKNMFPLDVIRTKLELFNSAMMKVAGTSTFTYDSNWIDDVIKDLESKLN